ncbi:fibroblast growth factor receptor substrate 2 [Zootermopsis nevadensis]|nr:fibroblast growth factor receptor substrate 2 [Zootermopsis nevadensis]
MGCISSKTDINDLHPNIFQVMNVDELGNRLSPGQLEITETDLVLYQKKKDPVKWPLRCLRRYGFEAELFSFESGRRCPTGSGIYAFRCQRAEQLFNLLQTHIQVRNNAGEDAVFQEFPVPSAPGPAVAPRLSIGGDATYLDLSLLRSGVRVNAPNSIRLSSQNGGSTRLSSVGSSSNGPLSPQGTASPSPPPVPSPSVPVLSVTNNNNPALFYANEEFFLAATACTSTTTGTTTTTTTTTTTVVTPTEPSERSVQQQQPEKMIRLPDPSSETIPGIEAPTFPTDVGNKTMYRQSMVSGDGIPTSPSAELTSCAQMYAAPSYINIDLSAGVEPLSPTCSIDGESTYARLELTNDAQDCHLYMNIIPGPENGVPAAPDKPSTTIWPKPAMPSFGMQQQEWELEEPRHCYANIELSEIEVARSHLPKRLSGTDRVPPLPLHSFTVQSQQNPMTPPPGMLRTVNYIMLDLDQNKTDSVAGNTNSSQQPASLSSAPPSSLSLPPESPGRASERYATIDFNKTVALSHSVNPNVDNDSEGSRKTRHNSTINDLVLPPTRLSSSE